MLCLTLMLFVILIMMACLIKSNVMKKRIKCNPFCALSPAVFFQRLPIEELRFTKDENGVYKYNSDVSLLLNAERIKNQIGEEAYLQVIKQAFNPKKTPYEQGKYKDEDLIKFIKPRYVQAASEIRSWTQYLMSEVDSMVSDAKLAEQMKSDLENSEKRYTDLIDAIKGTSKTE